MTFCTVINCIDGRVQLPVIKYLQQRFGADYVDTITEPGPALILYEQRNFDTIESIHNRLDISIENHNSVGIAVVGHHDCAGNPVSKDEQVTHLRKAIRLLQIRHVGIEVIGLWVDSDWVVHEVA